MGAWLGTVDALDVGPCEDPEQHGLQFYVSNHHARADSIRFICAPPDAALQGRLGTLTLRHEGARYRVEAVCTAERALPDGRVALTFEAQHPPEVRGRACDRHGVVDLGAALLLDALADDE